MVGGDDILDISGDDSWNSQELQKALSRARDPDPWTGSPDDVEARSDALTEDDLGSTAFRDALTAAKDSMPSGQNRVAFQQALRAGKGDQESSPFQAALAEEKQAQKREAHEHVEELRRRLGEAQTQGAHLAAKIKEVKQAKDEYGPPALKGNFSQEERENYYSGFKEHHMGEPVPRRENPEPYPWKNLENVSLDYFDKLRSAQFKERRESILKHEDDVLSYPYAGGFCTYQLNRQIIKPGQCTRASPIRCNKVYQLCEMRIIEHSKGKWVDVEPQADCAKTYECEKIRENRRAEKHMKREKKELKVEKKRTLQVAQGLMEERDRERRERIDDAEEAVKKDWQRVKRETAEMLYQATLKGNAPLPTERYLRAERAMNQKIVEAKKKLQKFDERFAELGTLDPQCKAEFKQCEQPCPPLDDLKLQTENACRLKCRDEMGKCIARLVDRRYREVAATAKAIKEAVFKRKAAEKMKQEEQEAAEKKEERDAANAPAVEVGEAQVFKMDSGHGIVR